MVSILASRPCCPRFDSWHSHNFFRERKFSMLSKVNLRRCLEERVQWLKNVDWTHLVLASGKLVLKNDLRANLLHYTLLFKWVCTSKLYNWEFRAVLEVDQPRGSTYFQEADQANRWTYLWAPIICAHFTPVCNSGLDIQSPINSLALLCLLPSTN